MHPGDSSFFRTDPKGVELFVRLTPRGSADRFDGADTASDGRVHLKARVRAVPEKGAANAALESLVARHVGVARGQVTVVAGGSARLKTVRIEGDADLIAERLRLLA